MPPAEHNDKAQTQEGGSDPRAQGEQVAGVRLADGRQLFVAGVPADLPVGALVRLQHEGAECTGTVSIPPELVLWRDPTAYCAAYLALEQLPVEPVVVAGPAPLAILLADEGAPDERTLAAMIALAQQEQARLDD